MRSPRPAKALATILGVMFSALPAVPFGGAVVVSAQAVQAIPPVQPIRPDQPIPPMEAARTNQPVRQIDQAYLDTVRRYASGDHDAAMAAFVNLPARDLDQVAVRVFAQPIVGDVGMWEQLQRARRRRTLDEWARLVPAAAVMHVEAGTFQFTLDKNDDGFDHLDVARTLLDPGGWAWIVSRQPSDRRPYEQMRRDVYLAIAWTLQQFVLVEQMQSHLKNAREAFPNDAEILLASGSAEEMIANPVVVSQRLPVRITPVLREAQEHHSRQARLDAAEEYHRAALKIDPRLAEAHMRLGRVLQERGGRAAEARRSLETARDLKPPSDIGYLAALFLARLTEDEGDAASAHAQYVAITTRWPDCQAGHLGSSRGFEARGDRQAALGALLPLFRAPKDRACPVDPWWTYGLGQAWRLRAHMEALRARVRA